MFLGLAMFAGCAVAGANVADEPPELRALSDAELTHVALVVADTFRLECRVRAPAQREDGAPSSILLVSFKSGDARLRGAARAGFAREVAAVVAPLLEGTSVRSICVHEAPQELGAMLDKLGKVQPECVSVDASLDGGV